MARQKNEKKTHITRNRISYSCQKCRERKVKCDKVHPVCGSCQRMDEKCVYSTSDSDLQPSHEAQAVDTGRGKKRKQSLTESHQEDSDPEEGSRGGSDLQDQLSQLSVLLDQLGRVTSLSILPNSDGTKPARSELLTSEPQQSHYENIASRSGFGSDKAATGMIDFGKELPQHSRPDLDAISSQLNQLTELLRFRYLEVSKSTPSDPNSHHSNHSPARPEDGSHENVFIIPNERQRNAMFRSWLSSVYPVLPIVEPAIALIHYRTFHFWYQYGFEKGTPNPCEEFVPLVFAIYYAGVMSMSIRGIRKWFPGHNRQRILRSMRSQYSRSLEIPTKLLSNPPVLAARIMMCYMSPQNSDGVGIRSTSSPLVRTAYCCNLHRERLNESLERPRAEVRRRLWWETINLDTFEAIASSMPPSINHHFCDASIFSEVKDHKLVTPEADEYETRLREGGSPDAADDPSGNDRSSTICVFYLFMKVRTTLFSNARKLLNINLAAKPKTEEDMAEIRKILQDVDRYVSSNLDRIPTKGIPEHDFMPKPVNPGHSISLDYGSAYGEDLLSGEVDAIRGRVTQFEPWQTPYIAPYKLAVITFHKWARIVLSMLMDHLHCFSYAPFLRNSKRKLWITARQCALRNAHSCIRKFNCLVSDLEFERFRWTWPSMYHPIHACIIILLDCYENPTSLEAPRSRTLLDQMLSLSSPEHGIVGGDDGLTNIRPLQDCGNEAYIMLLQLRAKGWDKAGLDPSLLWTEQDQIDIGIAKPLTESEQVAQSLREDRVFDESISSNLTATSKIFGPIMQQRAKEVFHPSMAGIPDEMDHSPNYHDCTNTMGSTKQNGRKMYKRARPDQQLAPTIASADASTSAKQSGYVYKFKLPSELYDIDQLLRKIRSVQQKKPDQTPRSNNATTTEEERDLSRQIATANIDLTNFLASKLPDGSRKSTRVNLNQNNDGVEDDDTVSGTPAITTQQAQQGDHPSYFQPQPHQTPPLVSDPVAPPAPAPKSFASSAPQNRNDAANPTGGSSSVDGATNVTMPDLIAMDFDWDKWDDLFGHILDDGYSGFQDGGSQGKDGMAVNEHVFGHG